MLLHHGPLDSIQTYEKSENSNLRHMHLHKKISRGSHSTSNDSL